MQRYKPTNNVELRNTTREGEVRLLETEGIKITGGHDTQNQLSRAHRYLQR